MKTKTPIKLPKDALSRVDIGQSFAEYDVVRQKPFAFVVTPAMKIANDRSISKCFYVGRRGTGKTAINYYLLSKNQTAIQVIPELFDIIDISDRIGDFQDTRQRPFKSLVTFFERTLLNEALADWSKKKTFSFQDSSSVITRERNYIEDFDFDSRAIQFSKDILSTLTTKNEKKWLQHIRKIKDLSNAINDLGEKNNLYCNILIDRIDESWSGSDAAVILLMALMHACIRITASVPYVRPMLFLRENIFERVRQLDNEFARLETSVVPLDWTMEQLLELIERRLNLPFNTRLPLGGTTWDYFFEELNGYSSREMIFGYCQYRPRDILTYCGLAIQSAQAHNHEIIKHEDIQEAKRRFSDSRLKDLGDEYSENYPQIQLVLSRFYGLGDKFSLSGIEAFIKKIIVDEDIKNYCAKWVYKFTTPNLFIELFYNIGFFGIVDKKGHFDFRTLGPKSSTPPPVNEHSIIKIHSCYSNALNLRDTVITTLDESIKLQDEGILLDIPDDITLHGYQEKLKEIQSRLNSLPCGKETYQEFEEIVGEIIQCCFFRSLTNVQPKERDHNGVVIRDWIVANRATNGFWEMIRQRYDSTQVIWECKNFEKLNASCFHQTSYYMNKEIGRFVVMAYRGKETKKSYYEHVKRIANQNDGGIVLLLTERDLNVFLRQSINGKFKQNHIYEIYDRTVREIS